MRRNETSDVKSLAQGLLEDRGDRMAATVLLDWDWNRNWDRGTPVEVLPSFTGALGTIFIQRAQEPAEQGPVNTICVYILGVNPRDKAETPAGMWSERGSGFVFKRGQEEGRPSALTPVSPPLFLRNHTGYGPELEQLDRAFSFCGSWELLSVMFPRTPER